MIERLVLIFADTKIVQVERIIKQFFVFNHHFSLSLLYRNTLGQIARTVNVLALAHGDVVGQQLQRNAGDEWLEAFYRVGQFDDMIGKLLYLRVSLRHQCRHSTSTGTHLLDVGNNLFV